MGICHADCTAWSLYIHDSALAHPKYKADPDIAGIWIVCAFVATSSIILVLGLLNLVFTASDGKDGNVVDYWIFRLPRYLRWFHVTDDVRAFWIPIVEKVVLFLSDQQILTGLSILIIGFATQCSISAYHFALVDDLAWFSANSHLTSLGIVRNYLYQRPTLRNWRICMMLVVAAFIVASTVMQGHWAYFISWSFNAQCLFANLVGNVSGQPAIWMWADLAAIALIYPMAMLPLYEKPFSLTQEKMYDGPMRFFDAKIGAFTADSLGGAVRLSTRDTIMRTFFTAIRAVYFWSATLMTSRCIMYVIDLAWFSYGIANVVQSRDIPKDQMIGSEDILTFGQLVPILLLCSTLFVFKESYQEQKVQSRHSDISQLHLPTYASATMPPSGQRFNTDDKEDGISPVALSPQPTDIETGSMPRRLGP